MAYIPPSRLGSCAHCGSNICLSSTSAPIPYCRACRKAGYIESRERHGQGRYRKGCRCDTCRAAVTAAQRLYVERRKAEGRPVDYSAKRKSINRTCLMCGSNFMARRDQASIGRGNYCSGNCQRSAALGFELGRIGSPKDRWGGLPKPQRDEIFARDAGLCHICSVRTEPSVRYPSPLSLTIDHIIPRSRGGDDRASNLATAHFFCNSRRGNRLLEDIDRTFYSESISALADEMLRQG